MKEVQERRLAQGIEPSQLDANGFTKLFLADRELMNKIARGKQGIEREQAAVLSDSSRAAARCRRRLAPWRWTTSSDGWPAADRR